MLRLKEILAKKRVSQKNLAFILGVNPVTVCSWAQNKSEPSLKTTLKICEILKIKLSDLVEQK